MRGTDFFEIKVQSNPSLTYFVAEVECAMKCIETVLHVCTLNSHLPTLLLHAVDTPHLHTSAGPAPVVWSIGLLFLVLSVHRLWIAELAAILGGITLSFSYSFHGEALGWVRRKFRVLLLF